MLENATLEERDSSSSIQKLVDDLNPLRERLEFISNLTKAETSPLSPDFESLDALRKKIEQLEVQ